MNTVNARPRLCLILLALGLLHASSIHADAKVDGRIVKWESKSQTFLCDLGSVRQGLPVRETISIQNGFDEQVAVSGTQSSCACTTAKDIVGKIIPRFGEIEVPVSLDVGLKIGKFSQSVTLRSDALSAILVIEIVGVVEKEYEPILNFGQVLEGASEARQLELRTWPGQPPLVIDRVEYEMDNVVVELAEPKDDGVAKLEVQLGNLIRGSKIDGFISLVTNDSEVQIKRIRVIAEVLDDLVASESKLFFGLTPPGEIHTRSLIVSTPYSDHAPTLVVDQTRSDRFSVTVSPSINGNSTTVEVSVTAQESDSGILKDEILLSTLEGKKLEVGVYALVKSPRDNS